MAETMSEETFDQAVTEFCENVNVINNMENHVIVMGLKNSIVGVSHNGVFVADKEQSSYIDSVIRKIGVPSYFTEKSWGGYEVLHEEPDSLIILVTLNRGNRMRYHSHQNHSEMWIVVSGSGNVIIDEYERYIKIGDVINLLAGCKHTVVACSEMKIIEVQFGNTGMENKKNYDLRQDYYDDGSRVYFLVGEIKE